MRPVSIPQQEYGYLIPRELIDAVVKGIVDRFSPKKIILFGSYGGEGSPTPDSDLDFLVVVPDDAPRELLRGGAVYHVLAGTGYPKDVIPWRQSDFDLRAAHVVASLPATVLREGRLLYDARRRAA